MKVENNNNNQNQSRYELKQLKEEQEEVELLIGTCEGEIYLFDPVLRSKSEIKRFNSGSE